MSPNLEEASRKERRTSVDFKLIDSITAHALLNLADSTKDEEHRFRAILKAEEVVVSMDATLAAMPPRDVQRQSLEKARFELAARLEQAMNAVSVSSC